ncbi:hypothetical protein BOVMAS18_14770 [Streptococcus uberis]
MLKRKNLIIRTFIIISILLISYMYCLSNLNRNAVYYSSHIPHSKHKNPELTMVASHLDRIKLPNDQDYKINLDGHGDIIYKNNLILGFNVAENEDLISLMGSNLLNNNGYIYYYYKDGKYLYAENNKTWKKDYSNIRKQEAVQTVSKIIDPIVKAQPKPKINLQWLFDWKYKDRFQ